MSDGHFVKRRAPLKERLWRRVIKTQDGCWLWTGSVDGSGYGTIGAGGHGGRTLKTHRVSWMLHHKSPVPLGKMVCHLCDTPNCVRPDHLFLGTAAENNADRKRKGRNAPTLGERHPRTKLINDQVREIYRRAHCPDCKHFGLSRSKILAREYGVSIGVIKSIRCGQNWSEVTRNV